jgi:hypothetical protein
VIITSGCGCADVSVCEKIFRVPEMGIFGLCSETRILDGPVLAVCQVGASKCKQYTGSSMDCGEKNLLVVWSIGNEDWEDWEDWTVIEYFRSMLRRLTRTLEEFEVVEM